MTIFSNTAYSVYLAFFFILSLSSCDNPDTNKSVAAHETEKNPEKKEPRLVETITLQPTTLNIYEYTTATVESTRKAQLSFKTAGNVVYIKQGRHGSLIREGDIVNKGELLAKLDSQAARIDKKSKLTAIAQAKLNVTAKKNELDRAKRLNMAGAIADKALIQHQVAYKQALLELDAAQIAYDQAENSQADRNLIAPFSGVITAMNLREGQRITPITSASSMPSGATGAIPITIMDPSRFEAVAQVPLHIASQIQTGQKAYLFYGTQNNNKQSDSKINEIDKKNALPAKVVATSLAVNPSDRTIRIRLRPNRAYNTRMIDGSQVNVWFEVVNKPNVLMVPLSAIQTENDTKTIFIVDDDHQAVKKTVQLGQMNRAGVEVITGLAVGDRVVVKGASKLSHDMPVTISKYSDSDIEKRDTLTNRADNPNQKQNSQTQNSREQTTSEHRS